MTQERHLGLAIGFVLSVWLLSACVAGEPATPTAMSATATSLPPTATPKPTSTPTPPSAEALLQAAFDAQQQASSYRFSMEMLMTLSGPDIGEGLEIPMHFSGDIQPPDRIQGTMTISSRGQDVEFQVVGIGDTSYVKDAATNRWEVAPQPVTAFDPEDLVVEVSDIEGLQLLGEETVDAAPAYHLKGQTRLPYSFEAPLGQMEADMLVDYWIGKEDQRMLRSTAAGSMNFTGAVSATVGITMTVRLFDYNLPLEIVAPEIEPPPTPAVPSGALLGPLKSDDAVSHMERGLTAFEDDRPGLAAAHFTCAMQLEPDLADAYLYRGLALAVMDETFPPPDFDRVIELRPDHAEAYLLRALFPTYGPGETGSDRCADSARALELRVDMAEASVVQASCVCVDREGGADRAARAFELFQAARAADPAGVDSFYALAALECFEDLYNRGDIQQIEPILPSLDKDIASNPDLPGGYFARAQAILWLREYTIEETVDAWIDMMQFLKHGGCPNVTQRTYGFDRSDTLAAGAEYLHWQVCIQADRVFDSIWDDQIDLSGVDALMAKDEEFKAKFEELQWVAQEYSDQVAIPPALGEVRAAALASGGDVVATFTAGPYVAQFWSLDGALRGVTNLPVYTAEAAFSADGRWLATGGEGDKMRLWDVAALLARPDGASLYEIGLPEDVDDLAFSPDGSQIGALLDEGEGRIWSVETGEMLYAVTLSDATESLAIAPRSRRIALAAGETAAIVNAETGKELFRLGEPCTADFGCSKHYVAVSPDEKLVAVAGRVNPDVTIWDMASGELVSTLGGHLSGGGPMAFSPDSRFLASGGGDGVVRLWDAAGGKLLHLMGHRCGGQTFGSALQVWALVFSADGRRLLTGGEDGTARLWDTETGEELAIVYVVMPETSGE